jgi:hypothetical protein
MVIVVLTGSKRKMTENKDCWPLVEKRLSVIDLCFLSVLYYSEYACTLKWL